MTQERTFYRPMQLAERWNTSGSTIRRLAAEGKLPAPVRISERVYGWSLDTIKRIESERDKKAAGKASK